MKAKPHILRDGAYLPCEAQEAEYVAARNTTLALVAEVKRLRTIVSGVIFNAARISRMVNDRATAPGRDPPPMSGPVWAAVAEITGNGSTRACELCREFGVDPTTGEALQPPTESD